jgi:UDP-N-acetylmuramate--alanine ligase
MMTGLKQYDHIYFLGIGGIGMSALARCCMLWGIRVSGYDRQASAITDALVKEGAKIHFDDDPEEIDGHPDLVIFTPAIPADSRLKAHFIRFNVPLVKRSEALESVTAGIDTIAVAGTHGKTTTSSMISYLLYRAGIKHTAILGGIAANYHSNFHSESLELMVVEADEYDRSFLRLHPRWVVVTAMDPDHLDIYGTYEAMLDGYRQFISQIQPGGVLLYRSGLKELIGKKVLADLKEKEVKVLAYGVGEGDFHTEALRVEGGVWHWNLVTPEGKIEDLALLMPGRHNVQNATAACAMALQVGAEGKKLQEAMPGYKGVSRRFEIRYKDDGHVLIDDYAHHPEELVAAITAARETFGGPVTGVFQPHLYSRTRDLAKGFAEALDLLDYPVIIDIYPAREEPIEGVSSQTIFDLMKNPNKKWCRGDSWIEWVIKQKPDVFITLGAGDLDKHIPELIRKLY